jgi:hypothetical protein
MRDGGLAAATLYASKAKHVEASTIMIFGCKRRR